MFLHWGGSAGRTLYQLNQRSVPRFNQCFKIFAQTAWINFFVSTYICTKKVNKNPSAVMRFQNFSSWVANPRALKSSWIPDYFCLRRAVHHSNIYVTFSQILPLEKLKHCLLVVIPPRIAQSSNYVSYTETLSTPPWAKFYSRFYATTPTPCGLIFRIFHLLSPNSQTRPKCGKLFF